MFLQWRRSSPDHSDHAEGFWFGEAAQADAFGADFAGAGEFWDEGHALAVGDHLDEGGQASGSEG